MHRFTSHRDNTRRYFLNADLPDNPICWLFGHRPRAEVQESKYAGSTWVLVECRWCGRRCQEDLGLAMTLKGGDRERAKKISAARIENARRDPVAFAASYDRRQNIPPARLELSLEVVDRREEVAKRGLVKVLLDNLGVSLRVGTRWSESPYHVHVDAGVVGVYASAGGVGRRFASWIGRGHKRELALSLHGGHVWWKVWYNDDGGNDSYHRCDSWRQPKLWPWSAGRRKHRGWMCLRQGNLHLNPADELWGTPKPDRKVLVDDVTLPIAMGAFPGDTYLITGKLERWDWAREHGPRWARKPSTTYAFDWRSDGIPVSTDRDWKGNDVLGSGVTLTALEVAAGPEAWTRHVIERVTAQMQRDRKHYGYTPPRTVSS